MSSGYTCPKCNAGFPEKAGKVRVSKADVGIDGDLPIWERVILDLLYFLQRPYYIRCPSCGYRISNEVK